MYMNSTIYCVGIKPEADSGFDLGGADFVNEGGEGGGREIIESVEGWSKSQF